MPYRHLAARQLGDFLSAIAHPRRIQIIEELRSGKKDVGTLQKTLGISYSNVSQHLATLRAHRVVAEQREGRHVCYHLRNTQLARWLADGIQFLPEATLEIDQVKQALRQRSAFGPQQTQPQKAQRQKGKLTEPRKRFRDQSEQNDLQVTSYILQSGKELVQCSKNLRMLPIRDQQGTYCLGRGNDQLYVILIGCTGVTARRKNTIVSANEMVESGTFIRLNPEVATEQLSGTQSSQRCGPRRGPHLHLFAEQRRRRADQQLDGTPRNEGDLDA